MKKLLGIVILAIVLAGCGEPPPSEYDRYKAECQNRGGFITVIEGPTWSTNAKVGCIEANPPLEDLRP